MKLLSAFVLTAMLLPAAAGEAQAAIRTGTLTCDVAGGVGWLLASSKQVTCRFTDIRGGTELYAGDVRKVGVDLGVTSGARIVWAVFEPAIKPGSLAGSYSGVSAEATAGIGLGANVLVGGGNGGVTLQPLSIQGQTGFNVAGGIGILNIAPVVTPVIARTTVYVHHHRYGYGYGRYGWHRHYYQHVHYHHYRHVHYGHGYRHHRGHRYYRHDWRRHHDRVQHHHVHTTQHHHYRKHKRRQTQ